MKFIITIDDPKRHTKIHKNIGEVINFSDLLLFLVSKMRKWM